MTEVSREGTREGTRRWWPGTGLLARFDNGVLCAPTDAFPKARALLGQESGPLDGAGRSSSLQKHPAWPWLQAWCHAGVGSGRVPLLLPWRSPAVKQRLTVAIMEDGPQASVTLPLRHVVQAFALAIDGSDQLQALPSDAQRLAWRVQIKLAECLWWRGSDTQAPWDAGYVRSEMQAQPLLAQFRPRRPTLVVAACWSAPALAHLLRHWSLHSTAFDHAVRLLVLQPAGTPQAAAEFEALWAGCALPVSRYRAPPASDRPAREMRQARVVSG
jgi:hypothetical protein